MIPFVVVGGMLVSLSVSMGAQTSADGTVVYIGLWNKIHAIGNLAFTLMYPILSGFIAFSIAGRATLAPAMIGAMVATDGEILERREERDLSVVLLSAILLVIL